MTPRSEWFGSLVMPAVDPVSHSLCWLINYLVIAIVAAEFFIERPLRRRLWTLAVLFVGNALWCAVFFRLHNALVSLLIISVILADLIYITAVSAKHTRFTAFFAAALTCWYVYLTGLNLLIVILN